MKKANVKTIVLATLFLFALILSGCGKTTATSDEINTATLSPEETIDPALVTPYPSTAEGVVREFLNIYPVTPEDAVTFLSPAYVQTLDENSVLEILPEIGAINGFIISQGASSSESEKSEVLASVLYEDRSYEVTFNLVIDDGRWVIEKVTNSEKQ